jgi:hypothetical protein
VLCSPKPAKDSGRTEISPASWICTVNQANAESMDANIVVENLYDEWKITAFVQLIE